MKSLIAALVLVAAPAFASPAPVACGTHEKNVANAYAEMVKRGEASKLEALQYTILSAKAEVACGNVAQADSCKVQSQMANDIIDSTQNLINSGMAEQYMYDKAVIDMTALIAPCTL